MRALANVRSWAVAALAAAALGLAAAPASAEIKWQPKLDQASRLALAANRPMFIEFWAVWCGPCKEMEATVYADPRVSEAMRRVTPVRIDIDRSPEIVRKYAVEATPTIIVADSLGNEIFRHAGALTLESMLQLLGELPRDVGSINTYASTLAARKDDYPALTGLARELRTGGFYVAANKALDRALRTKEAKQDPETQAQLQLEIARNYLSLGASDPARRALQKVISDYPKSAAAGEARRLLGAPAR